MEFVFWQEIFLSI